ncbi:winged helix-turn-helix transcriptional regulator [Sphingobium phenoxybenzoativorans]|uniref:Winged helix-turn-helix transcriptional regulator n=1 Tax=Sphingobium phenoxybenzoativorans TaxID=1592790 RepID=A0A975Q1U6_9SPHN|nr:MarR family winged helix-turn-helix transcriptional regulator [Sphingobium phenoxybenzoativorans]QUT06310.1 winged helix-turn-helix transcriptional regulator [Sphingobium phenoxybenzoativorans]
MRAGTLVEMMMDSGSPMAFMACNCIALRRAARRISNYYDACLAPLGLRATQFSMLALLGAQGAMPVNGLARALDLDRSTAGQNLRPLERDGLVDMGRSETDGRARVVRLTPAGEARLAEASVRWRRAQAAFEAANGAEEASAMRAMLAALDMPPLDSVEKG